MFSAILGAIVISISIVTPLVGMGMQAYSIAKQEELERKADTQYAESLKMSRESMDMYEKTLLEQVIDVNDITSTSAGRQLEASIQYQETNRLNRIYSFGKTNRNVSGTKPEKGEITWQQKLKNKIIK